jgi:hypothetical protein
MVPPSNRQIKLVDPSWLRAVAWGDLLELKEDEHMEALVRN